MSKMIYKHFTLHFAGSSLPNGITSPGNSTSICSGMKISFGMFTSDGIANQC